MGKVLVGNINGVTEDRVEALIQDHVEDPEPHPIYDDIAEGRFITYLRNGMS